MNKADEGLLNKCYSLATAWSHLGHTLVTTFHTLVTPWWHLGHTLVTPFHTLVTPRSHFGSSVAMLWSHLGHNFVPLWLYCSHSLVTLWYLFGHTLVTHSSHTFLCHISVTKLLNKPKAGVLSIEVGPKQDIRMWPNYYIGTYKFDHTFLIPT